VGFPSLYSLSFVLIFLLVGFMIFTYVFGKRKSVWVMGFFFMNTLFMFMTRMHERYQFVVLIFILMAAIVHKHRGFFYCFAGMSVMTLVNQVIPMFSWRSENSFFDENYGELFIIFSVVNLILYFISAYVSIRFMFEKEKADDCLEEKQKEAIV